MANNINELIERLGSRQDAIWESVTNAVSEAAGSTVVFSSPLTVVTHASDLANEVATPMLVIQFAFASTPDSVQVVLIPQQTVIDLASWVTQAEATEADESTAGELRPISEAIVQGICLGVGKLVGQPIVASALSIRFQIFSFPDNLQEAGSLARVQIALSADETKGSVLWLMDDATIFAVLGEKPEEDEEEEVFPQDQSFDRANGNAHLRAHKVDDGSAIDLLRDIPLELSVELGRVQMLVRDVIELGTGSIVELDKSAGEPVDVLVNGRLVARGEVVVIEDNFGVRISEILNPNERLGKLGEAA